MTLCLNQTLNFRTSNPVLHYQDINFMMQIPIIPSQLPQLLDQLIKETGKKNLNLVKQ